jgi:secreted PhoX family phosphatase
MAAWGDRLDGSGAGIRPAALAPEHRGSVNGDWFGSPDGLWLDPRGILLTQTNVSTDKLGEHLHLARGRG